MPPCEKYDVIQKKGISLCGHFQEVTGIEGSSVATEPTFIKFYFLYGQIQLTTYL